jgi:hypothetical protein
MSALLLLAVFLAAAAATAIDKPIGDCIGEPLNALPTCSGAEVGCCLQSDAKIPINPLWLLGVFFFLLLFFSSGLSSAPPISGALDGPSRPPRWSKHA